MHQVPLSKITTVLVPAEQRMGINLEFVASLIKLRPELPNRASVVELGAQDISANPSSVAQLVGDGGPPITTASELYTRLGFVGYTAIDLNGGPGDVRTFDLNFNLYERYGFAETFDLVTNLGTLEHCFDQASGFRNMHQLTKLGGLMVHCFPSQGLVNHAFYNYHPRLIAELAFANRYEVWETFFTTDFKPDPTPYSIESFQAHDDRDVLVYAILKRTCSEDFKIPTDRMFTQQHDVMASEFRPYVKAPWSNILRD